MYKLSFFTIVPKAQRIGLTVMLVIFLLTSWIFFFVLSEYFPAEAASTHTITTRANFDLGYFNNTETYSQEGEIKLKANGTWNARSWRTPYLTLGDGTTFTNDGTYTYMLVGRDLRFVRYLPDEDRWQARANAPHMPYIGADMAKLGDYIYVIYGGYQKEFSRYSLINNTWEDLTDLPELTYAGASIQTDGRYLYILRGSTTVDFWRYDPVTNAFTTLSGPLGTVAAGADLIFDDSLGTDYLYTPRGANTTTFYRYDIAANSWSTMTAAPGTLNDTGNMTKRGDYIYTLRGTNVNTFYRYQISTDTWATISNTPATTRYVGLAYNPSEDLIYVYRGNSTYDWWKYDPDEDSFLGPTDLPVAPGTGADIIHSGGYIYYRRGANTTTFYRYEISTGNWSTLAVAPAAFNDDTKGIAAGSNLYFLRGSNTTTFYRYNPTGDSWSTLAVTPAGVGAGASLAYPGSGDYIYATRGNGQLGFWRYHIDNNTWDDAGAADIPTGGTMSIGARLVTDGTDIYAITGIGISNLYKYTTTTDTWTLLGSLPFAPYYGTDAIHYNGRIYVQAGNYKVDVWEYIINTNTWRRLPDMTGYYANDVGPYNGGSIAADTSNGVLYSINGQNITRLMSFTPAATNYPASGTWISETIDLSYVSSFNSLTASTSTPSDAEITLETRTSGDKSSWTNWQTVEDTAIASTAQRYIQLKATLQASTDQTATPILYSLTISYEGDVTAPSNPSTFIGSSQAVGGSELTSGSSYPHPNPYFSWSGATDGQTSVSGYYVYFGTDSETDPATDGTFQTLSTYTVTTPMTTGTYYLRLKTKDTAGNTSAATTGFTYTYNGVSPPQTSTATSTENFTAGTATNINVSDDELKLDSKSGFWLEERLSLPPTGVHYGAGFAYVSSSNKLYTFRGQNTTSFYEYDIDSDTWTSKAVAPAAVYQGGDLVEGPNGYLYGFPGRNLTTFWRYEIATDTWSDAGAADSPLAFYYGSSLIYDGSRYIYALRGNSDDAFLRYDTSTDMWDTLANLDFGAPNDHDVNTVYVGGDMAFDGDDTIYAIQGNWRTGFSSYSINGGSWSTLPDVPVLPYDGSQIAYDSESNAIYFTSGWSNPFIYKFDISTQQWTKITDAPNQINAGSAIRNINGELYILRGGGNNAFWKYNIEQSSWQVPNMGLFGTEFRGTDYRSFGYGADIIKGDGNYFYMVRGNYDNLFVRYESTTGESVQLTPAPAGFYIGGTMTYDSTNNKIYAIPSQYVQRLYIYDVETDTWSEESSDPPPSLSANGSALQYDGSRYIYWIRGGANSFYRFDTEATAGNKWSQLSNLPAAVGYGSDMVIRDGYIYALRGNNQLSFYLYDIAGASWSDAAVTDLPSGATIYNDGFLVNSGGDLLYACRGGNQIGCYQYSIQGNSWSEIANPPANIYQGGAAATNGSNKILVIAGNGSNTYSNGLYTYVMQTDSSSFEKSGSFISDTHDLTGVYKFASIAVNYTSANNATLTVLSRSSADNSAFSSWSEASELKTAGSTYIYKLNSPSNRYVQLKFDLTSSDGIFTGIINDYAISYYQDADQPTNPSSITAYESSSQLTVLTTNNWYNYAAPHFDWPDANAVGGASDTETGSGVSGYYVYYGTEADADPEEDGSLVTNSHYTASGMTTGSTSYLRIKTVDDAGNVNSTTWQPFIYKYDTTLPTNPSTIVANPPGYTATNSFTFTWSGAADTGSGLALYCYKTGAEGSSDTCTTETSVSTVVSYRTGSNTFYIRAKDAAGNYASDYATATYYYSSTAPGAPTNLTVEPDSNTVNSFAFAWQPPETYFGSQSGLRYFYSVNAAPTANNVNAVGLEVTYLSAGSYATQKGTNTFYVVTKDEAGNINYSNYASVEFAANTSAPGIPQNIEVADVSVKETSSWKIAVSWEPPSSSGSGIAHYKVYRSTVAGASCTNNFSQFENISSTTGKSFVDTDLTQTTHSYCITSCTSTNDCSAPSDTMSLLPDGRWRVAATLVAEPTATVKTRMATISWFTGREANSFVKYGKSSGDYGEEVGSSDQVTDHEVKLTNLDPGTKYYYKVLWTDEDGNLGESDEYTLLTNEAPFVSSVKVTNVSLYESYVNFTVKNSVVATVQYGKTASYGAVETLSTSTSESTYSVKLTGLTDGTLYHLRIVAEDEEGNTYNGDDYTFETLPVPKISNLRIQQVEGMPTATLRLLWTANTRLTSVVSYYPVGKAAQSQDAINLTPRLNHEVILKDLLDETEYVILVKGKDSAGNEAKFETRTVKTALDLRPPEVSNINVESTIVGIGEEARSQIIISWDTDEPSTSQVEYGEGTSGNYSSTSQEDGSLTFNHSLTIPGLTPSKIYHFRIVSRDKNSNKGISTDTVVITPNATKDAMNLVIDRLSKTFKFLKQ